MRLKRSHENEADSKKCAPSEEAHGSNLSIDSTVVSFSLPPLATDDAVASSSVFGEEITFEMQEPAAQPRKSLQEPSSSGIHKRNTATSKGHVKSVVTILQTTLKN